MGGGKGGNGDSQKAHQKNMQKKAGVCIIIQQTPARLENIRKKYLMWALSHR